MVESIKELRKLIHKDENIGSRGSQSFSENSLFI